MCSFRKLVFAFLSATVAMPVAAETVRVVADINQYSGFTISQSVSAEDVVFHRARATDNTPSRLWRSTLSETSEIDISAIQADATISNMFLTQNYLYLWRWDYTLHQMTLDGQQLREVSGPPGEYFFDEPIAGGESDVVYFLENGPDFDNDGSLLFKLDERSAVITQIGEEIFDRLSAGSEARIINDRIVYNAWDSVWSVDLNGQDVRQIKKLSDSFRSNVATPVFTENLMYFAVKSGPLQKCSLWRTDGTIDGTFELTSLTERFGDCRVEMVPTGNNRAVISKVSNTSRAGVSELWETSGTVNTTREITRFRMSRTQERLDLTRVGDHLWYRRDITSGPRSTRSIIYITDLSFANTRRLLARPGNTPIGIFPLGNHMLIQVSKSATSIVYLADENGDNLKAAYRGIGSFSMYEEQVAVLGDQALLPFQTLGEPREFLMAVDLESRQRTARLAWKNSNHSSALQSRVVEGPDGYVYFCATGATAQLGASSSTGVIHRDWWPAIWRTDGSEENTDILLAPLDSSQRPRSCGDFGVGRENIYFTRTASLGPGLQQTELWTANLDGTDQKLLIDVGREAGAGRGSMPRDLFALDSGSVLYTAQTGIRTNAGRKLVLGDADGSYTIIGNQEAKKTEIVAKAGDRYWVRSSEETPETDDSWSLWVSDGTEAGTQLVARRIYASNFVEVNGDVYYTAEFRENPNRRTGLFRVASGESSPLFVSDFSDNVASVIAFDGDIVFIQPARSGETTDQLRRFNIETGGEVILFDSSTATGNLKSIAVLNGSIYVFKDKFIDRAILPDWQIWRSSGSAGDAVLITEQNSRSADVWTITDRSHGYFKPTASALWFFAGDEKRGNELWQLTP